IIASDSTHVTIFSGDGKVHPAYITSGQIASDIHGQPSHRAFLLLTYVPYTVRMIHPPDEYTIRKRFVAALREALHHEVLKLGYTTEFSA
ncbi:hypothetical protein K439DRAFT_1256754, partial [Ramaria rubella]